MSIAIHKDDETTKLNEEPSLDERELQSCLERSPSLLLKVTEPPADCIEYGVTS